MGSIIERIKNLDKRLWIYLGVVLGIIVMALLISKLVYLAGNSKKSYSDVESMLKKAGINYYKDNISLLPKEDGEQSSVGDNVLSEEGYIKSLDKLLKNDKCTGKVTVTKDDELYTYASYLNCGKSYTTMEFYKKITAKTVSTGDGLYEDANGYRYRGDNPNNYVQIDKNIWRIISIDQDNNIELVINEPIEMVIWDDRYNSDNQSKTGYNNFDNSRMKQKLEDVYDSKLLLEDNKSLLNDNIKTSMLPVNNCVDKYKPSDSDFSSCANFNKLPVSLISIGEYIKASIDPKCKTPGNADCQNYNYLAKRDAFWTVTGNGASTSGVYKIRLQGAISTEDANSFEDIYPVIKLSSGIMYSKGNGTIEKPYIIR